MLAVRLARWPRTWLCGMRTVLGHATTAVQVSELRVDGLAEACEDLVHASAEYEAGYLVVRGRWFSLEQRSPRGYKLRKEERIVIINHMIRVPWVLFNGCHAEKAQRESRSGLYILDEDWYNRLFESV